MHTNNITPPYLTNKTVESKVMLVLCDFLFHLNFLLPILSPMNNNGVILFSMFYFPLLGIKKKSNVTHGVLKGSLNNISAIRFSCLASYS